MLGSAAWAEMSVLRRLGRVATQTSNRSSTDRSDYRGTLATVGQINELELQLSGSDGYFDTSDDLYASIMATTT